MNIKQHFETWYEPLKDFIESEDFINIGRQIRDDRAKYSVIPNQGSDLLFKVFRLTPYNKVRIVLLGQDCYDTPGAYDGLAFSNSSLTHPQPSLRNILAEVESDIYNGLNLDRVSDYSLYSWSSQGILLINTALTVRVGQPESHLNIWKPFTEFWIRELQNKNDIIWLLLGRKAQSYKYLITNPSHYKIETAHPSPLGAHYNAPIPFTGSKIFSKCNTELRARNLKEIVW